jgi:HEAT repeats
MREMTSYKLTTAALVCLVVGASVAPAQGKKGGIDFKTAADLAKLKEDVERLRADLDAARREIAALKAAAGGKIAAEEGPLYRGRSAKSWLEQLKDLEPKTRIDALEALGALAEKDKKLIPVLLDTATNDKAYVDRVGYVQDAAVQALGKAGPEALPNLIDLVNDKRLRHTAINAIGAMEPKAKSAAPVVAKTLEDESHPPTMRQTIYSLQRIGPDAKAAIPALVKALGKCLEDIGKDELRGPQIRFGVFPDSVNVLLVETLSRLDPALSGDVKLPIIEKRGINRQATAEEQEEWRALHASLVKRYLKQK